MVFTIWIILRVVIFLGVSAAQSGEWHSRQHMLVAAENRPIAPMNSSTGMPLSSWTFLNAWSDICFGDADCAPACAYPGRPQAGDSTAVRFAVVFEGSVETAAARMVIPVPPLTSAT